MLNNKSVMLKVLVLALSVLMLVSLAACNKDEGVAQDDVNNAIASALASQSAAQAEKDAALQSSIEADQAKQDAEQSSALESIQGAITATSKTEGTTASTTATTAKPKEDITAIQAELAKLKHEYTYAPATGLYSSDNYTKLVLLFESASVKMLNTSTIKDAQAVLEQVKVDAEAIPSAKNSAAAVQAQIAALGDIEMDVFTTSATKVKEARKAFVAFLKEYKDYCETTLDSDKEPDTWNEKTIKKLGIAEAELDKAEAKLSVLTGYIKTALVADMKALYVASGKEVEFDEEGADLGLAVGTETAKDVIARAYYQYLILAAVNGGDVADAKVAIDWEFAVDKEGDYIKADGTDTYKDPWGETYAANKKTYDVKKPTAFFTAEQFINVYVTPYLNDQLAAEGAKVIQALNSVLIAGASGEAELYTEVSAITLKYAADENYVAKYIVDATGTKVEWTGDFLVEFDDVEDALEDVFEAFEAEIEALTFVGNYKGTKTMAQAKADMWAKLVDACLKAGNEIIKASQAVVGDFYDEYYEAVVEGLDDYYEDKEGDKYVAAKAEKLAAVDAAKASFLANAAKATTYGTDVFSNKELADKYGYKIEKTYDMDKAEKAALYVVDLVAAAITDNFASDVSTAEAGQLGEYSAFLIEDLMLLRDRLDPKNEDGADLYLTNPGTLYTYRAAEAEANGWYNGEYWSNAPVFEELVAVVDKAIADISAISVSNYKDKNVNAQLRDEKLGDDTNYKGKSLYFASATARDMFYDRFGTDEATVEYEAYKMVKAASNPKNADLVTVNETSYPITFTYTASEQALEAAGKLYVGAFNTVQTQMLKWYNVLAFYSTQLVNDPAYQAALKAAEGNFDLTNELNVVLRSYMDDINKQTTASPLTANGFKAAYSYNAYIRNSETAVHFTDNVASGSVIYSGKTNGERYLNNKAYSAGITLKDRMDEGFKSEKNDVFKKYNNLMFANNTNDISKNKVENCIVLQLWSYKTGMARALTDLKAQFKNTYTAAVQTVGDVSTSIMIQTPAKYGTAYDIGLTAPSAQGAAYEAQIDALFDSYIDTIMNLRVNTKYTVTDVSGNKIVNGVTGSTINNARRVVNGYLVDLVGQTIAETLPGYAATKVDEKGISRIDRAYKVYYTGNYQ